MEEHRSSSGYYGCHKRIREQGRAASWAEERRSGELRGREAKGRSKRGEGETVVESGKTQHYNYAGFEISCKPSCYPGLFIWTIPWIQSAGQVDFFLNRLI